MQPTVSTKSKFQRSKYLKAPIFGVFILIIAGCSPSRDTLVKWAKTGKENQIIQQFDKIINDQNQKNTETTLERIKTLASVGVELNLHDLQSREEMEICANNKFNNAKTTILESLNLSANGPINKKELVSLYLATQENIEFMPQLKIYISKIDTEAILSIVKPLYNNAIASNDTQKGILLIEKTQHINNACDQRLAGIHETTKAYQSAIMDVDNNNKLLLSNNKAIEDKTQMLKDLQAKLASSREDGKDVEGHTVKVDKSNELPGDIDCYTAYIVTNMMTGDNYG